MDQLQIRVSPSQKAVIQQSAARAHLGMSEWVLRQIFPDGSQQFQELLKELKLSQDKSYVVAEIHDLFHNAIAGEFEQMVAEPPSVRLSPYWENYLAAMVEYAANQKKATVPPWVGDIEPLESPQFGSALASLRLYLLTHSPASFRRRNIFIDSTVGQRV